MEHIAEHAQVVSVTEIRYELNFSSPSHFIVQFKKQFLITPKKYRSQL